VAKFTKGRIGTGDDCEMKTVFITGGNGFIGRNLVESLREKYNVLAPTHKKLDLLSQEEVAEFFNKYQPDYVIHCANVGGNRKHPSDIHSMEQNLHMFFNITQNVDKVDRIIYFGSGAEYRKTRDIHKVKETEFGKHIPVDYYGFSKYIMAKSARTSDKIVNLRLFGVFGKYEDYEYKFISNSIIKNLLGFPIRIRQNVCFDWIYINDLMKIAPKFLERGYFRQDYNITPKKSVDLVTIAKLINKFADKSTPIIIDSPGMNYEYTGDNNRLVGVINGFKFESMPDSIKDLMSYYWGTLHTLDTGKIKDDEYIMNCKIKEK
jgi:nucleoside-diphosphate-sugar epimerase